MGGCNDNDESLKLTWQIKMSKRAVMMTPKKDMNYKRYGFAITYDAKDKEVYVFGGDFINHCEKYIVELNEWILIEPMTKRKYGASACMLNNQFIFVIGGLESDCLNDIEKYVIQTNSWETVNIEGAI